jgi:hypothetical protein
MCLGHTAVQCLHVRVAAAAAIAFLLRIIKHHHAIMGTRAVQALMYVLADLIKQDNIMCHTRTFAGESV